MVSSWIAITFILASGIGSSIIMFKSMRDDMVKIGIWPVFLAFRRSKLAKIAFDVAVEDSYAEQFQRDVRRYKSDAKRSSMERVECNCAECIAEREGK